MPDRPSRDGRTSEPTNGTESTDSTESTDPRREADPPSASPDPAADDPAIDVTADDPAVNATVDETVQRRLREAYLNDEEGVLVVTGVRSADDSVVVEMEPPHGGTTHVERFRAPRRGSLSESEAFLQFLATAGVSPLAVDELIGERVPATYDADGGWQVDEAYLRGRDAESNPADDSTSPDDSGSRGHPSSPDDSTSRGGVTGSLRWVEAYRYWLLAGALILGELAFIAVIILLYA